MPHLDTTINDVYRVLFGGKKNLRLKERSIKAKIRRFRGDWKFREK